MIMTATVQKDRHRFSIMASLSPWFRPVHGSSIVEVALLMPVLLLILVGAVDLGRAYFMAIEVASAAHAGALYGVQNPTDVSGMESAAQLNASDVPSLVTTATYGCECSDGSLPSASCTTAPSCPFNVVNFVQISTTATYTPLIEWPGIPSSLVLTGTAFMRSAHQ